ncbi:DUF596 domain-containing protein [Salmonella enterica subsp. salamae]|nr:DUF596 domain-containing protein [Salmonella enterica subsp. salamae]EDV1139019.1 DUF596 domain-containing protein [Salmonella enterica subsp. enterica]ECE6401390.1 DUF596 domain-containing protein [Salmonella enterica subsp. salamae]ECJ2337660.1 DUF596 domain-containing protein [Salmonella enterica subsp. salamae]EDW2528906.1 DUF596 domain-containing protein [Salmonella enterica subsp. salamae]
MKNILREDEYQELVSAAEGQTLDAVLCYSAPDSCPLDFSFNDRREIFFWVLERLLKEGKIKLAKNGKLFDGTINEQIERFKSVLPKTEEEID